MKAFSALLRTTGALAAGSIVLFSACTKTHDANATTTAAATNPSATAMPAASPDTWDNIKDFSYTQRAEFIAKANAHAAQLDAQASLIKGPASARLAEARTDLHSAATDLNNATADTWESAKERVGRAWQQADSAMQNVAE